MSELKTIYVDAVDGVEVVVVTPSAGTIVSVDLLKSYAKIETEADDLIIDKLIKSAIYEVERYCSIALLAKTLRVEFTGNEYWKELPIYPVGAISEVKTVLQDATEVVHASGDYQTTGSSKSHKVHVPSIMTLSGGRSLDQVHVTHVAGYTSVSLIPMPIQESILQMATMSYQIRDILNNQCITIESNPSLKQKLFPFRKEWL